MAIDHLIVGDNQFFGVNHRSEMAGRNSAAQFERVESIIRVLQVGRDNGAGGVMLSAVDAVGRIIPAMLRQPDLKEFHVYPIIPYVMKYADLITKKGMLRGVADLVGKQGGLEHVFRLMAGGLGGLRGDYDSLIKSLVDLEMAPFRGSAVTAVFLHNGIVDLMLGLGFDDLLLLYDDYIRTRYAAVPGYGTLNLPLLAQRLRKCGLDNPLIMAPVNAVGFNMNPSVESCEDTIRQGGFTLLAMNVLASGVLAPEEAFEYLARVGPIAHVVLGASSERHLQESFRLAKRYLPKTQSRNMEANR